MTKEVYADFKSFLRVNRDFWLLNTTPAVSSEKWIFVDVAHDNPAYLVCNLIVGKYLQKIYRARIVAFAKKWQTPCPNYDASLIKELVDSYLIDEFVDLDHEIGKSRESLPRADEAIALWHERLKDLNGHELRKTIVRFEYSKSPAVGRQIYNTYLRSALVATIDEQCEALHACAVDAIRTNEVTRKLLQHCEPVACVLGHYEYSPYGQIASHALSCGATVYMQSPLLPVSIKKFKSEEDLRCGRPSHFSGAYKRHIDEPLAKKPELLERFAISFLSRLQATRSAGGVSIPMDMMAEKSVGGNPFGDRLRSLGMDENLPTVCLFAHAMSDSVLSQESMIFDDFGQWMSETLRFAAANQDFNVLVRPHPLNDAYETTGFLESLREQYRDIGNISFIDSDFSTHLLIKNCHAIVTVHGTPGFETSIRGGVAICAGKSRYSGLNAVLEPDSQEEYFELLSGSRIRDAQRDRFKECATVYGFFELVGGRSYCHYLPSYKLVERTAPENFWTAARSNLEEHLIEEDPLLRNLVAMHDFDLPFLLNLDVLPLDEANAAENSDRSMPRRGCQLGLSQHATNILLDQLRDLLEEKLYRSELEKQSVRHELRQVRASVSHIAKRLVYLAKRRLAGGE